jgi:fido (protein-threonine AMPylation protein)
MDRPFDADHLSEIHEALHQDLFESQFTEASH